MSALREAVEAIQEADIIGVASHVNPDGDSVGSLLALNMVLGKIGKKVYSSLPEPWKYPPQYNFLPGKDALIEPEGFVESMDLFVALDCSIPDRLGMLRETAEAARAILNIDHHEDNNLYGDIDLVDAQASSTAELVYKVVKEAGWPMDAKIATCIYTGLLTDTGRFQHRNTSPETFIIASELAAAGADIFNVVKEVYENQSLSYTKLLGRTLQRMEILEELRLAYSWVLQEDLMETGAVMPETEDLIDHLRKVRGTSVVALFKELPDGKVRVSLRSRDGFEVGPIARELGGGGHAMAAGYTSEMDIEGSVSTLLARLRDRRD
jgi:phosphoesterase RecJ-like protein